MPDLFSLDNSVVAVIGAGSGIGEAVALGAAAQGAKFVACLDVHEQAAARVAEAIQAKGGKSRAIALDIADEGAVTSALDAIVADTRPPRRSGVHAGHQRAQADPRLHG